jgi:hypothetical protein
MSELLLARRWVSLSLNPTYNLLVKSQVFYVQFWWRAFCSGADYRSLE